MEPINRLLNLHDSQNKLLEDDVISLEIVNLPIDQLMIAMHDLSTIAFLQSYPQWLAVFYLIGFSHE